MILPVNSSRDGMLTTISRVRPVLYPATQQSIPATCAVTLQSRVRDGRSLYVVLVGSYRSYDEAKARAAEIKQRFSIDSFVLSR